MTARIWKDRVQQTVTGTPGTGAFTLSTAVAGYQALAAGDDGKIGCFVATEGTSWETFIGTYTHSGTSLARTTRTDSSTGSAISFTAAAVVFLDLTATMAAQHDALTNFITGTDAAVTMVANAKYVVDMSAWATADRNYTCPASPSVGDRVTILVQAGNASFELIVKGNTSQTINGGSAASEWTRLFITGESVTLLYVASNTWLVDYDGRIPMKGLLRLSTSAAAESAATLTYPTTKSGVWTADNNVGSVCVAASDKIIARRACASLVTASAYPTLTISSGAYITLAVELNQVATSFLGYATVYIGANGNPSPAVSVQFPFAVDDYIRYQYSTSAGSRGLLADSVSTYCHMSFTELLP